MATAVQRGLLPAFAEWFVDRVEAIEPDFLIPAETKGARLLDVVLDYAREELGRKVSAPVLYRPALPYLDKSVLRESRVLVLDDARKTGISFTRHRRHLEECGVSDLHGVFCVSFDPVGDLAEDESFIRVADQDAYRDYICQMTELVTVGGLPPEVDHQVFELKLPGGLRYSWGRLEAALGRYGQLSVDVPEAAWARDSALTLHFPELPGTWAFTADGYVRDNGPNKLRLFPDSARDTVYVVPVTFPTLDLPAATMAGLADDDLLDQIERWGCSRAGFGGLLLGEIRQRHPEAVFRALSAFAEVDLVRGLARAVSGAFGTEGLGLQLRPRLAERLYGPRAAGPIAARIGREIEAALHEPAATPAEIVPSTLPLFVDPEVVSKTEGIANRLRTMYEERREVLRTEPTERVGLSFAEISSELSLERLLVSRCIDFGLALTTLVPWVEVEPATDGSCRVTRKYRVSEQGQGLPRDRLLDNKQLVEEIAAYVSTYISRRCKRYRDRPVPVQVVTRVIAMIQPDLSEKNISVSFRADAGGLRGEVFRGGPEPLLSNAARAFALDDGQILPTEGFEAANGKRALSIDHRQLTVHIEGLLDQAIGLLELELDDDQLESMTAAAALNADGALGLTYFQEPFERVLDKIEDRLVSVARGHEHRWNEELANEVAGDVAVASDILDYLDADWAAPIRAALWEEPVSATESLLRAAIGMPEKAFDHVYLMPRAVLELLDPLVEAVTQLDGHSSRLWDGEGSPEGSLQLLHACFSQMLGSLRFAVDVHGGTALLPAGEERKQINLVARLGLEIVAVLRAIAAACGRDNRGPRKGESFPESPEEDRLRTMLLPDLEGSRLHGRDNGEKTNFNWKQEGLGLFAQWAAAFGGVERIDREGDCSWLEFERLGDPAVLAAATARVHAAALRETHLTKPRWRPHVAIDVGPINEGDHGPASRMRDEMNAMCRVGQDSEGEPINVTRAVFDACTPAIRESRDARQLSTSADDQLPPGCELWVLQAEPLVEALAAGIGAVSRQVLAELGDPAGEGDLLRDVVEEPAEQVAGETSESS